MKDKNGRNLSFKEFVNKVLSRIKNICIEFFIMILHIIGCFPSHHIRRFFYRITGISIGNGSTIHTGARFYTLGNIKIGEDSIIGEAITLDARGGIVIGNHVDIASQVMIYTAEHDVHSPDFESITASVTIDDYVFIGPRVIILPGVTIKKGAIVAAGAVVTKDVEEFEIVGGVPAHKISERKEKNLRYRLGRARWFR